MSRSRGNYGDYVKPLVLDYLRAAGLDVTYSRASGDTMYYPGEDGREIAVLDMVGGFGASLVGHNHPEVVAAAEGALAAKLPFHAQASVRGKTGDLAKELVEIAGESTGRKFLVTFANSGAEAVEAALKHAEMERGHRIDAILGRLAAHSHDLRRRLREHTAILAPDLLQEGAKYFGLASLRGVDDLLHRLYTAASTTLEAPPIFLAVEGAFHGKTSGSVQLTHRREYQAPWRRLGPRSTFLPAGDVAALERAFSRATLPYLDLESDEMGVTRLVEKEFVNIAACFAEPVQGEGGVRELSAEYLHALRDHSQRAGVPFVLDEIQSGMGRTGRFFAGDHSGVVADYYLLSKALGGGLAKISALLVDSERYLEEFGFIHTSTFADDDFSAVVAAKTLEIIRRDDSSLIKQCEERGALFLSMLREVQKKHPAQIAEVRGRGLMIGVEMVPQDASLSPLIRVLSDQDLLGFVISGYFLHEHQIRVAPTLSSRATLRLEPSYQIEKADFERFCAALSELAGVLESSDAYRLLRYVVRRRDDAEMALPERKPKAPRSVRPHSAKVAFLTHFLEPEFLRVWEPSLAPFSVADCEHFLAQTRGMIDPFVVATAELDSSAGTSVHATIIGLPFIPEQAVEAMREGEGEWATELIEKGVELGRQLGCSVVGFGGYTSILTNNCRAVEASDVALTSGNSLTAAAGLDALFLAAHRRGIEHRILGVIGAVGNIGRVLADVAADEVDEMLLIGSGRGQRRLERSAADLCVQLHRRLGSGSAPVGLAKSIADAGIWERWRSISAPNDEEFGDALWAAMQTAERPPLRIGANLSACRECNLLLTATNSARPIVAAEHLADKGPVVICDVAVPRDVDPRVLGERKNVTLLQGGLVKAPMDQVVDVEGMDLRPGEIYGCLGETILLGLAGIGENYSYGSLDALKVRRIREIARTHGFTVEENPLEVGNP